MPGESSSSRSLVAGLLQMYAQYIPFHRGKQQLVEHLTERLGISLSGERVVKRSGLWWALDPADYVCHDLFWCGAKEVAELRVVREHMPVGGVLFDVGASFGYYSLMIASALGQRCTVHAFEPNPAAFARLTGNLDRNGIRCVHAHPLAAWDTAGHADMVVVGSNSGGAYLTAGSRVALVSIDEFCRAHDVARVDVIKVDAEGSEWHVLRGAARTLAERRPTILMELNAPALHRQGQSIEAVLALLDSSGYVVRPVGFRHRTIDVHALGEQCAYVLCTPAR